MATKPRVTESKATTSKDNVFTRAIKVQKNNGGDRMKVEEYIAKNSERLMGYKKELACSFDKLSKMIVEDAIEKKIITESIVLDTKRVTRIFKDSGHYTPVRRVKK